MSERTPFLTAENVTLKWRAWVTLPRLILVLGPVLLMAPIVLRGQALFWGTPSLQFIPWWDWARRALAEGVWPLWNPAVGMGAPLIANYQSALFYPPTWLALAAGGLGGTPTLAWMSGVLVTIHLILSGLGMARLVRGLGWGVLPQTVAGLSYGLSGYLVARAGFLSINAAAAWLPWALDAAGGLSAPSAGRPQVLRFGALFGLQLLAGHAQTTWYTLLLAVGWLGYWTWVRVRAREWNDRLNSLGPILGRFAAGLAVGTALSAVQLLPTAVYLIQSQRAAAVDFETAMTYSFWPWRFLTLLAPDLFGNPVRGDYWGYASFWEDAVYAGLLTLFLAIRAVLVRPEDEDATPPRLRVWGLVVLGLSFLLALGSNTPVFPWLFRHVPTFDMFQAPARYTLWAAVVIPLLAALGVRAWRRPEGRGLYWARLGTAGALAVSLGAGLGWAMLGEVSPTFIRATALAGLWGVGVGILTLTAPPRGTEGAPRLWAWAVAGLLLADLLVAGWGLNPGVDRDFYAGTPPTVPSVRALADGGRLFLSAEHEYDLKFERFLRFDSFLPEEAWENLRTVQLPNLHLLDGTAHTSNFDPLVPGRYSRWMHAVNDMDLASRTRLLNLMAVGVVETTEPAAPYGVRFEALEGWSRARWLPCALGVENAEQAWNQVFSGGNDLQRVVVLEGVSAFPEGCERDGEIRILQETLLRTRMRVRSESAGWVFLSDVWYPGWFARVDGRSMPVLRANYLFRAVAVDAGEHVVEFVYRPWWFYVGLVVSGSAWIAVAVVARRRSEAA